MDLGWVSLLGRRCCGDEIEALIGRDRGGARRLYLGRSRSMGGDGSVILVQINSQSDMSPFELRVIAMTGVVAMRMLP